MISRFFIDRPIFASVLAILVVLAGLSAMRALPIEQYPNITPPQIQVTTTYLGASAETVSATVASPLETQINGVENMIYMNSQNSASGDMSLSIFFDIGSDINQANIDVQNRVSLALSGLPQEVQRVGVSVRKQTPSILLVVAVQSPDGRYDEIFTSNYTTINIVDELKRLPGVSDIEVVGARDYSMRLWLKPDRMAQLGLTATDVINAVNDQNQQFAVGTIGKTPNAHPVEMTVPISAKGRLKDPAEFENIILRANPDGSMIRLKDIGRAELGAYDYSVSSTINDKPTTLVAIFQQYGANALSVAESVKQKMHELSENFPQGITYSTPYDTTLFVKASIKEVAVTILEAAALVTLIMLIFLQNLRATLIPLIAMIVSIIGAFAGMYILDYSINTLTLFGMVLSVGIVVDDAIVVTENIESHLSREKITGREAAIIAMDEVTGAVIAIMFVLVAVFIPVAFIGGIAGQLYKQFAVTIAVSVTLSGLCALILSPALAALLLKPKEEENAFGKRFNRLFERLSKSYLYYAKKLIDKPWVGGILCLGMFIFLAYMMYVTPSSLVPEEDQGYFVVQANLPDSASLNRSEGVAKTIWEKTKTEEAVDFVVSLTGFSLLDNLNRNSVSSSFVVLKDWDLRKDPSLSVGSMIKKLGQRYDTIPQAKILCFNAPAIQGLGSVGGFEYWVENRGSGGISGLEDTLDALIAKSRTRPEIAYLSTTFSPNALNLYVDLDREKARSLQVPIADIFLSLQTLLGSVYINDFNKFGRVFRVVAQAEPASRETIRDIGDVYVRSLTGQMIPLKALVNIDYKRGPELISRFNNFEAIKLNGAAAPGYSSGDAMKAMEEISKEVLTPSMKPTWSGISYQEKKSSGTSTNVFIASLIMVFLILAALYERWSSPFVIIMSTPFGVLGAFFAIWIFGKENDLFFQIGLITMIALSVKNAILIVEFAMQKRHEGKGVVESALEAAGLRLRAIIMTSLAMVIGLMPLILSKGAGAASRHSVAIGMIGGMIAATFLALLFVPLFFVLIEGNLEKWKNRKNKSKEINHEEI